MKFHTKSAAVGFVSWVLSKSEDLFSHYRHIIVTVERYKEHLELSCNILYVKIVFSISNHLHWEKRVAKVALLLIVLATCEVLGAIEISIPFVTCTRQTVTARNVPAALDDLTRPNSSKSSPNCKLFFFSEKCVGLKMGKIIWVATEVWYFDY